MNDPIDPGRGALIVFEGVGRSGKSSLISGLADWMRRAGLPVTLTEWNSYPPLEALIKSRKQRRAFTPVTYSRLHLAEFAIRHEELVAPALERGDVVIADRWIYTALVRDTLRGLSEDEVRNCYRFARTPDLTFWIDIPPEVALQREEAGGDASRYRAGEDIWPDLPPREAFIRCQRSMSEHYARLAATHEWVRLDGSAPPAQLLERALSVAAQRWPRQHGQP